MMKQKNRIRLHRNLQAQTTPYPEAGRWVKRGVVVLVLGIVMGIYFFARPDTQPKAPQDLPEKQILGEQDPGQEPEFLIYTIKKGDTLFNISQRYNISWQTIAELNRLEEPYVLKIGQTIKIPK